MTEQNLFLYCNRMAGSQREKLFFLESDVFKKCEVIIDFGCADGLLISLLKEIAPDKMYIGIDNSDEMLALAKSRINNANSKVYLYNSIDEIPLDISNKFYSKKVGIILSSVLHEIFSFSTPTDTFKLIKNLFDIADCTFIRDMLTPLEYGKSTDYEWVDFFNKPNYDEFKEEWCSTHKPNFEDKVHYKLKSLYMNNWGHEIKENYFSINWNMLFKLADENNFKCIYKNDYINTFIKEQLETSFLNFNLPTHRQLIFVKNSFFNEDNKDEI